MTNPSTRRDFLTLAAAAAATSGSWKELLAATLKKPHDKGKPGPRNMFFNFSHEEDAADATYHLVVGGRRYPIQKIHEKNGIRDQARQTNTFLQNVPDSSLTHVIPAFIPPADAIQLCYVMKNRNLNTGLWSMTSMFFVIPLGYVSAAHELALSSGTPLEISAKRKRYSLQPGTTVADFLEEEAVTDISDHATALVALHSELLSGHPGSAAYIQKHLIQRNVDAYLLSGQIDDLGEAEPQQAKGVPNANGWATLTPYRDSKGNPLVGNKGTIKGLILYNTEWHPEVQKKAGLAIKSVLQKAKDDTNLGADITAPINGGARPPLAGTIWHRRDGITSLEQSGLANLEDSTSDTLVVTPGTPFNGYSCDATVVVTGGKTMVTLDLVNSYLRWLGIWVEFVDAAGVPIPYTNLTDPYFTNSAIHTETAVFVGALSPEWTIYGVPVENSTLNVTFPFASADHAVSANIIASGLGNGTKSYPDTIVMGAGLTVVFNLLAPTALLALGASESIGPFKKTLEDIMNQEPLVVDAAEVFLSTGDEGFAKGIGIIFGQALAGEVVGAFIKQVVTDITEYVAADAVIDCIPIVGQIIEAIGALGTIAELVETSAEVATSPWVYLSTLTPIHDVDVEIVPDTANGQTTTPDGATECVITALFDSGATPRVVRRMLTAPVSSVSVHYASLPLGGNITVSAGFYQGTADDPHKILLGQASSGLVPNTTQTITPSPVIKRFQHPITQTTKYAPVRQIYLDATNFHAWIPMTQPPTKTADPTTGSNLCQGQAGSLCDFRAVTVSNNDVGYAWNAFGAGCGGGSGNFDFLANVDSGASAQDGYGAVGCGLGPGAKIAYSLLGQTEHNFYLNPDTSLIRRVKLGGGGTPTDFDEPGSVTVWGRLNFPSDVLILHPTGILVSISNVHHRLETLKPTPVSLMAGTPALANVHGGLGSRPGLLTFPILAAVAPNGVILVLEQGNNRLQAFDIGGNPVQFFKKQTVPYFLSLAQTSSGDTHYLDIAVEHTGFIYVLSYNDGGGSPWPYRLDIYSPDQPGTDPISTTLSFNVARIAVDFWRNVYGLTYEPLKKQDGTFPALTEPSVSEWGPQG